jgi:hypothetical protein
MKEDIALRPWIDNVDLGDGVDALRGVWDGRVTQIKPVRNLEKGVYGVYVDGLLVEKRNVKGREAEIAVVLNVGGTEVELVALKRRILS